MPLYTYQCSGCGGRKEAVVSYGTRDARWSHRELDPDVKCSAMMVRGGVEMFSVGAPAFRPGAVMADGSVREGLFGKTAPRKRKSKA